MKNLEYMYEELKKDVGEKLFKHCYNVMQTSVELAKKYNVAIEKSSIAGLLHDCGKLYNQNIGSLEHANLGRRLAQKKYDVNDDEILDAILYHTTGKEAMSMLEKIVYLADKIEPNRKYENVDRLRQLALTDIDKAIIESFENTFKYLQDKGISIDKQSIVTYEYLKNHYK